MTLRIIVRTDHRAHPEAPVAVSFKTFDIESPEIEAFLNAGGSNDDGTFLLRHVLGVEEIRPGAIDPHHICISDHGGENCQVCGLPIIPF